MEVIPLQHTYINWIFPAFLLIFGLFAFLRVFYPKHFSDYARLLVNDKYIIIYGKKERKLHLFTIVLYLLQSLCLALLVYVGLKHFGVTQLFTKKYMFLEIELVVMAILLLKLILQQSISSLFSLTDFSKDYIFTRIAYSSYAAIFVLLLLFLGIYTFGMTKPFLLLLFLTLLIINMLSWLKIIKNNLKQIKPYLFYFILYLCALEIAPYIYLIYIGKHLLST